MGRWEIILKAVGMVAVLVFLLLVVADCTVMRTDEIVEVEIISVRSANIMDENNRPQYGYMDDNTIGQYGPGDKVRTLKTKGSIFGWFRSWYLIEAVEE